MKKSIICIIIFFIAISKIYSQEEEPSVLQMNIGDEIWLDGNIKFLMAGRQILE